MDTVKQALRQYGRKFSHDGKMAQCPAHHPDRNPSLSISRADQFDGVLLKCHAGCDLASILDALGLSARDLFDNPKDKAKGSVEIARYSYTDETGRELFQKIRLMPKGFLITPGGVVGGLERKPPYRLPEVLAAAGRGETVYVVEGEKDADNLARLGLTATCNYDGAGKFNKPEYVQYLTGANVVIIADNDEPGYRHADQAKALLEGGGITVTVKTAAAGKDVSDHLDAGLNLDQLKDYEPRNQPPPEDIADSPRPLAERLNMITAADVEIRRVKYHWDQRIPIGAMTLMPGEEGIGKTTLGILLIALTTRGTLPGEYYRRPRDVIVIAPEDGIADVFTPRLREAGADLARVHFIRAAIGANLVEYDLVIPRDLDRIDEAVAHFDAAMIWIDSLVTTLPDDLKSIAYKDVAKVLKAVNTWADAAGVAVVAPWHLNKASGSDTAVRIMDSRAFRTAVRSMLLVVADPDAPDGETRGIVALDKANAGTLNVPALRYRIRSARYTVLEVDPDTGEMTDRSASCGVAEWAGAVEGDGREIARQALAPRLEQEGTPLAWLREYLTAEGEASRTDVLAAAKDSGFTRDQIKRAAKRLNVISRDDSTYDVENGKPVRRAVWCLPPSSATARKSGATLYADTTAPTAPTWESDKDPYARIHTAQSKLVQSVQSGGNSVDAPTVRPTEESRLCRVCGIRLHPAVAADGVHPTCDEAA